MRYPHRLLALLLVGAAATFGCQFVAGIDDVPQGDAPADGSADTTAAADARDSQTTDATVDVRGADAPAADTSSADTSAADAAPVDAQSADTSAPDADAGSDAAPDAPTCPTGVGPAMAEVISLEGIRFCVDTTEVTQAQYQQFLLATAGNTSGQAPLCSWNTSYASTCGFDPVVKARIPVTCVDWCDAQAFCAWNGKRLCGRVGGGTLPGSEANSALKDQWYVACSNNGAKAYPYGATYAPLACNTADNDAGGGAAWAAGSHASCQGGPSGVFDMSGNVGEWEDLCNGVDAGASSTICAFRGGVYGNSSTNGANWLRCDNGGGTLWEYASFWGTYVDIGFRCCADLP